MDFSLLQDFGLSVAVIAALFILINKFLEDMKQVRAEHKDERSEWRVSQEKRDEALEASLDKLSDAINAQNNRQRRAD